MKIKKPELLSPAGNWTSLKSAVLSGADSVYFGVKGINMRHLATNFDILEIKKVMNFLHEQGCKGYLTLNTIIMESQLKKVEAILRASKNAHVDGVILWDMSVLELAKKFKLPIHISTQASISNAKAVAHYSKSGVKRIVLARECTLIDIKNIIKELKKKKIKCEIETFIHGAMCVSISGRCFLSLYSHGKSANQGQCIQPCRREFFIKDVDQESEFIVGKDYVLSPKDLCSIDFIEDLIEAGISSFKIEGRIRSPEYVKVVTSVYRKAIDAYFKKTLNKKIKEQLKQTLYTVYTRGFSTGFYFGQPKDAVSRSLEHLYEKVYLGEVTRFFKKLNVAEIRLKAGDVSLGDEVLFLGKSTPANLFIVNELQREHQFIKKAKKGEAVGLKVPFMVKPRDKVFIWKKK